MRLTLSRAGGFAGSAGVCPFALDPLDLPEARRTQLLALLDAARVFEQPAVQLLRSPQPWDFLYSFQLQDGAHGCKLELHLAAVNPALRALVLYLEDESMRPCGAPD